MSSAAGRVERCASTSSAEGQTEETFVNSVLVDHLARRGIYARVRCVALKPGATSRRQKGGVLSYRQFIGDLRRWLREDHAADVRFTSMIDLYALPDDFPERAAARTSPDPVARVEILETALAAQVADHRFLPYVQLHEFEALLLADPQALADEFPGQDAGITSLVMQSRQLAPEAIDEGVETAPSKRIIAALPDYEFRKASAGPLVTQRIGLAYLRKRCRHFDAWVTRLERLAT